MNLVMRQTYYEKVIKLGKRDGIATPGWGACMKCNTSWDKVDGHSTHYNWVSQNRAHSSPIPLDESWIYSSGCFPLCEECWRELETPEARMPYYRQLWFNWVTDASQTLKQYEATASKWVGIEWGVNNDFSIDTEFNLKLGDYFELKGRHLNSTVVCISITKFHIIFEHQDKSYGTIVFQRSRLKKDVNVLRREEVMPYKDQVWRNDYTNTNVKVLSTTEVNVDVKTPHGFHYTYSLDQFKREYTYVSN